MNGREYQLKNKTYQAEVVEILDNGDAILELPDDLVEDMGWYEGTKLNISMENGALMHMINCLASRMLVYIVI
jgi:hypothetical protein